jgi:DNA uptake protein ComE-like DNA-binding protein
LNTKAIEASGRMDASLASLQVKKIATGNKKFNKNYEEAEQEYYDHPASSYKAKKKGALFYFDPNTISAESWAKLGLRDKTITTIMNYRTKGGKFKQAGDIKKIWGLFPDEAERLMPYITIAAALEAPAKNYSNDFSETKKYNVGKTYSPLDINNSDSTAWIALPGIGSKLSQRIINFRDKLGGFYSVNQVGETFGLTDTAFQKIKPFLQLSGDVKKISINTATIEELKMHPYIRYQLGNALVQYRTQHGMYKAIADIKKIMIVSEEVYNKLSPYLSVE